MSDKAACPARGLPGSFCSRPFASGRPVPGQLGLHGRCRCGVLLSPCFGALFVADLVVGMEELQLQQRQINYLKN